MGRGRCLQSGNISCPLLAFNAGVNGSVVVNEMGYCLGVALLACLIRWLHRIVSMQLCLDQSMHMPEALKAILCQTPACALSASP